MKTNDKPSANMPLVDSKPISVPRISSTIYSAAMCSSVHKQLIVQIVPRKIMISKATQTNDPAKQTNSNVLTVEEKRKLIRKHLELLLHAVLCGVRDELIGISVNARSVSFLLQVESCVINVM